ncbi:DNA-processing protein DprA [Dactylosporangium siamense]|uniref:DNA processing protein DprA n=1 Tax=Dactylosporangium siamense TaxID=685454 RepID=A0A919PJI9_9ACTN|nr:DNA-processing protein DprA [Dactylosporangium siamense]GIG44391.1 putative DNA processing protein DprA [Dactylosporangium siamense]
MSTTDRAARLALAHLVEPGSRELGLLTRRVGAPEALLMAVHGGGVSEPLAGAVRARLDAAGLGTSTGSADAWAERVAHTLAAAMTERAGELGARIVTAADDEWPLALDDLTRISQEGADVLRRDTDPPLCLWLRGPVRLEETMERSVSVVGARAVTGYGQFVASEFAFGLAERGWTVVSGGALGVDVTAHRGALAAGGVTCAVLACGIDQVYPVSNSAVFERIAEEGLLLTEWPPGTRPHKTRFLTRNRVIAAATRGTVMVEAGSRSGARNTLGYARRLQRSTMVVPGPVTSAMSVGCHVELRTPGTVLVTRVEEIVEEIGHVGELAEPIHGAERPEDALDATQSRVLDAVAPRAVRSAEEIAAIAGVAGRDARRSLPVLEQHGFIVRTNGGYRLASRSGP